jgi:hypothetical protein
MGANMVLKKPVKKKDDIRDRRKSKKKFKVLDRYR